MIRIPTVSMLALLLGLSGPGLALAQHSGSAHADCTAEHAAMGHCAPAAEREKTTHACPPEHAAMGHCEARAEAKTPARTCTPEHAAMGHCAMSRDEEKPVHACTPEHAAMGHCTPEPDLRQPREPIPPLTDADRAAAFPRLSHHGMAHGPVLYGRVTLHRLEAWDGDGARGQSWEGSASFGGDIHRVWIRGSGERTSGRTTSSSADLLASRAVARWWDVVAGLRRDFRPGAPRTRAAFGVQGIAPWMFEVSAIAHVGAGGGAAAELEAEYDVRFTNRLVLQPMLELELNSKDDPGRHIGSGLSKAEAGLRLRYEITRRFAPYIGIAHERAFGRTADYHEAAGEPARETRVVAGLRAWF